MNKVIPCLGDHRENTNLSIYKLSDQYGVRCQYYFLLGRPTSDIS